MTNTVAKCKRSGVDHNYTDNANVTLKEEDQAAADLEEQGGDRRTDRSFPVKLHFLLSELVRLSASVVVTDAFGYCLVEPIVPSSLHQRDWFAN